MKPLQWLAIFLFSMLLLIFTPFSQASLQNSSIPTSSPALFRPQAGQVSLYAKANMLKHHAENAQFGSG
jgi:hypothetical protein